MENRPLQLHKYQDAVVKWKEALNPPETEEPIRREFLRHVQEDLELFQAIEEGNPEEIAMEAVDGIIGLLQLIHHTGFNVDELMQKKIEIMHEKYNPITHQGLRSEGLTFDEAMAKQKRLHEGRLEFISHSMPGD